MKRKPIVYLICGFIGAGKTTFARKLEEKTGAVRITKDEWSIRFIGNDPTIDGYEEWDRKIIVTTQLPREKRPKAVELRKRIC
jgi:predicted kinase